MTDKMKTFARIGLIFVSLFSVPSFAAPWNCPGSNGKMYPFLCRGKFTVSGSTVDGQNPDSLALVTLLFSKSGTKAGIAGASLEPGQCSWADRGMTAQEPIEAGTEVMQSIVASGNLYAALLKCSGDTSCVIEFQAVACGNGALWLHPAEFTLYYPHN